MLMAPVEIRVVPPERGGDDAPPRFQMRPPARFAFGRAIDPRQAAGADLPAFWGGRGSTPRIGPRIDFGDAFGVRLSGPGFRGWRPSWIRAAAEREDGAGGADAAGRLRGADRPGGGRGADGGGAPDDASEAAGPPVRSRQREAVEAAKAFIEEHLGEPLDVPRISREVHLSRPHFTRVFREAEGVSPWRYVIVRRVRRAAELLEEDRPLSDVALETGFADQSHFTRVFKRVTGKTPGEYRKDDPDVQDGEGRAA